MYTYLFNSVVWFTCRLRSQLNAKRMPVWGYLSVEALQSHIDNSPWVYTFSIMTC